MSNWRNLFGPLAALLAVGRSVSTHPDPKLNLPPIGAGNHSKNRSRRRGRVQRHHNPPGTKLAKKARQGRLGLTTRGY